MPVAWSDIETLLKAAIVAGSEYDPGKVIASNQNLPKPAKPYIEVNFLDYLKKGAFDVRRNNIDGTVEILGIRQIPISIHGWGQGSIRALQAVMDSLHYENVCQAFWDENISFADRGAGVRNLTREIDNKFVEHGQLDIRLEVAIESVILDMGYFDTIGVESDGSISPGIPEPPGYAVELTTRRDVVEADPDQEIIDITIDMQTTIPDSDSSEPEEVEAVPDPPENLISSDITDEGFSVSWEDG